MEEWRDVVGMEGLYEVSSLGNVRSVDRIVAFKDGRKVHYQGKQMKLRKNTDGYLQVQLCPDSSTTKTIKVHRLVAEAFLQNPSGLREVNHIDENKTNNNVTNLEWCDRIANCNHGTRNVRISRSHGIQVLVDGKQFPSYTAAGEYLGVTGESVREAVVCGYLCRGRKIRRSDNG